MFCSSVKKKRRVIVRLMFRYPRCPHTVSLHLSQQKHKNPLSLHYHQHLFMSVVPEWSGFVLHLQCIDFLLRLWLTFSLQLRGPPHYWGGAAAAHHSGQCGDTRSQPLRGTPAETDRKRTRGMRKTKKDCDHSCRFFFICTTVTLEFLNG